MIAALRRLLDWLAADADAMWRDAPLAHIYAENRRRYASGRDPLRRNP